MNKKQVLIQTKSATPINESITSTQPLTCEIENASLVCILGQQVDLLNVYMEMLAGINEPDSGKVQYLDGLIKSNHSSALSYIYHNSALLSILNGIDNVKAPALYHQLASIEEIDQQAELFLAELEYDANHKVLPAFMNALQKKHLLIVRAIMLKPKVLFIENPFMDLDREQVRLFGKYLASLVTEKNITVITSNVNLDFVQSYADQVIYLTASELHVFKQRDAFSEYIKNASVS